MAKLRVHAFSLSLDGYGAGLNQSEDNPLGEDAMRLHDWMRSTRTFHEIVGQEGEGSTGVDDDFAALGFENIGAAIMGRNMFGPVRGPWPDDSWKGWWGPNPPYHCPVFVLTHHAREPLEMEGGTTFFFVTDGPEAALQHAVAAAGDQDIRLSGGVATVREYLRAGLVDQMHLAITPILLGRGERLLDDIGSAVDRYRCAELVSTDAVTHVVMTPH